MKTKPTPKPYKTENEIVNIVSEPIGAIYLPQAFQKATVLDNLAQNSIDLFNKVLKTSGLTIKTLSENIFEITPKTLIKYKNNNSKIPSRIAELAIELNALYYLGNEIFGNSKNFNGWLDKTNIHFNSNKPSAFLNTSTGIHFIYEELKRIEFGATA